MYQKKYRSDFKAKWICAPDEYLKNFDRPKAEEFPNAKFIWGRRYTRAYFRRVFKVLENPTHAYLHFICDNLVDIFINGTLVSFELPDTQKIDITNLLVPGTNLITVRAYQTASPDSFTSALTGGIHIEYANGASEDILTDESFENFRFIDFWENDEPSGWESDATTNFEAYSQLIVTDMHPIAVKRSCFFRKEFNVIKEVKRATLCASALGCYEAHLNGSTVDEVYFLPWASDSVKEYQEFDITAQIASGENVLSAVLGNGWYNCEAFGNLYAKKPALIMELTIEYTDGTSEIIGTDSDWLVGASPLTDNDLQFGERYDASLELPNWDNVNCKSDGLCPAKILKSPPFKDLLLQNYPFVRTIKRHPVKFIKQLPDGSFLYDCGINIAGTVELSMKNTQKGQQIMISVSERLDKAGNPEIGAYTAPYFPKDSYPDGKAPFNLRNINVYTAKGAAEEYYSPRFCYTGFRYVYINGTTEAPDPADITVREMHNDLTVTGHFTSEDPILNGFWKAITQTWVNNCFNGPTDCPTREKNFWTGDALIFAHLACWHTDCSEFLTRWTDLGRKMTGPYGWEDEEYMLPWTLYCFYGDSTILKEKYDSICQLVKWRIDTAEDGLLPKNPFSCYNDWLNPTGENLSPEFFSHCWYLHMLDTVSRIAGVLGDSEREKTLSSLFKRAKDAFNDMHYDKAAGEYKERIQSSAVLPLAFGLVPDGEEHRVALALHKKLAENGFKLTTGFQASRYILDVLTDNGFGEDAIKLLHQREFPSWQYMLDSGATNICESWHAMNDPDKSISMCHFSLGGAFSWFFEYLGGIRIEECTPGFKKIVLEPYCFEELGSCSVRYMTPYGEIISEWKFENGKAVWNYKMPDGITAEIHEPHIIKISK